MSMRNKVELISQDKVTKVLIDGVEIKGIQDIIVHFDVGSPRATLELKIKCDLITKEQPIDEVVQSDKQSYL